MLQMLIVTKRNKQKTLLGCSLHLWRCNAHLHVLPRPTWAYQYQGMLSPLLSFCLYFHALHSSVSNSEQCRYWLLLAPCSDCSTTVYWHCSTTGRQRYDCWTWRFLHDNLAIDIVAIDNPAVALHRYTERSCCLLF